MDQYLLDEAETLACLVADLGSNHAQNDVLRLRRLDRLCLRRDRHVCLQDLLLSRRGCRWSDRHRLQLLLSYGRREANGEKNNGSIRFHDIL